MGRDCPTGHIMVMLDDRSVHEQMSYSEQEIIKEADRAKIKDNGSSFTEVDHPKVLFVVRRNMSTMVVEDKDNNQRKNLIHARCRVKGKVSSMIINSGSYSNMVSHTLVSPFRLPTSKLPPTIQALVVE